MFKLLCLVCQLGKLLKLYILILITKNNTVNITEPIITLKNFIVI